MYRLRKVRLKVINCNGLGIEFIIFVNTGKEFKDKEKLINQYSKLIKEKTTNHIRR